MQLTAKETRTAKRLAKRLRKLRGTRTLRDVAAEAGLYHSLLSRYETGKQIPGALMLRRLAIVYGKTTDELLT